MLTGMGKVVARGSLPAAVRPYLPALAAELKRAGAVIPYENLARALGITPSRVQQIVLTERRKQREGDRAELVAGGVESGPAVGQDDAGHYPAPGV